MQQVEMTFIGLLLVLFALGCLFVLPFGHIKRNIKMQSIVLIVFMLTTFGLYRYVGEPSLVKTYYEPIHLLDRKKEKTLQPLLVKMQKELFHLQNLVFQSPDDPVLWWQLGKLYQVQQNQQKATEAFLKARELDDKNPTILSNLITSYIQANNGQIDEKVLSWCDALLVLAPKHAAAYNVLGFHAYQQRELGKAKQYWLKARQSVSNSEQPGSAEQLIAQLLDKIEHLEKAPKLSVHLSLTSLTLANLQPTDYLFITVKAKEGTNMPVAVKKMPVSDFQMNVPISLSALDAMDLNWTLADIDTAVIDVKVSHSDKVDDMTQVLVLDSQPINLKESDLHRIQLTEKS